MEDKFTFILSMIFYYILVIIGGVLNIVFGTLGNSIIGDTSIVLFKLLYIIIPICLLFVPIFLFFIFKNKRSKILQYSFISLLVFIILLITTILGVRGYFSKYSKEKWKNNVANRYCMIDDIEKNYNVIGKNKNEVIELLGNNFIENNEDSSIMYEIKYSLVSVQYYILYYDENNTIIKTEINWLG
ncbi:MAG: hypothetical protein HFJ42_01015 [Clostridia bacterium]|nr:hypothetical protein [Clostridia bacterium]